MAAAPTALDKTVRGILLLMQKMIREKGHGQVVVTIRDGAISLVEERRTYQTQNLPET